MTSLYDTLPFYGFYCRNNAECLVWILLKFRAYTRFDTLG
jgi:hypothetical protein